MRHGDDVHLELCGEHVVVAVFGSASASPVRPSVAWRCAGARRGAAASRAAVAAPAARAAVGPRGDVAARSLPAARERVPIGAAEGRVAAECLAAYPPGIPNVIPGERLTGPNLANLRRTLKSGGAVRGAADATLRTLLVVAEPVALAMNASALRPLADAAA